MNLTDIAELLGYLVSAWSLGLAGGYILTQYRQAMNHVG